jgi:hypothetical protein
MKLAFALLACALAAFAGIDGSWTAQTKSGNFTLDLKTKDGKITGSVMREGKKKPVIQSIQNARLDGNRLTFTTTQSTKKAVTSFSWEATVGDNQIEGKRTREGAKHGVAFTAKRAN